MFENELSMHDFTRLFSVHNAEVIANKESRFQRFVELAKTKALFDRPDYTSPWTAWFSIFPAILNRLQSSYEDCRFEFDVILEHFRAKGARFVFVGGDGLTVGRGNHLFTNNIDEYLDPTKPPWIIWVHGEMPHMAWHVLHARRT